MSRWDCWSLNWTKDRTGQMESRIQRGAFGRMGWTLVFWICRVSLLQFFSTVFLTVSIVSFDLCLWDRVDSFLLFIDSCVFNILALLLLSFYFTHVFIATLFFMLVKALSSSTFSHLSIWAELPLRKSAGWQINSDYFTLGDTNRQISELKFKLVKSEQEVTALEQNVSTESSQR